MTTTNHAAPATQQATPIDRLKQMIKTPSVQEQFKNALADNSEAFVASLIDLYAGDSYLQKCAPTAVVMEALKAAVMKLPISKALGFAYIIPYKKGNDLVPQFQLGYKGLIQLAMRTAAYRTLNADVVYEGEVRTVDKLRGTFDFNGTRTGDTVVGYFCYFELLNGFSKTLYMTKDRVQKHAEKYSRSYKDQYSPWRTEFDAMAIKTVIRNLLGHYGYLSTEMIAAIDQDPDQDVADRAEQEIRAKSNMRDAGFEGAQYVQDEKIGFNGLESNNIETAGRGPNF